MTLENDPPIQSPPVDENNGLFPFVWVNWFNDVKTCIVDILADIATILLRLDAVEDAIEGYTVWFDDNDLATQTTPISHTGGVDTYLTNDALGAFTNSYNPTSIDRTWDASSNQFDFSSLKIGDTAFIRFDFEVDKSVNNQEVDFYLDLAIGGSPYSLDMHHRYDKSQGVKNITFLYEVYMGDTNTLNNPAKVRFVSDDDADIVVNGWYTRITQV